MNDWTYTSLEEIFTIARGGSPRPIQNFLTDDPNGVNWIMIGDASEGIKYITSTKKKIRKEGVKSSRVVNPGDFLLTNSMSFGRPYIMKTSGCIHDGWLVLSPKKPNVDQDFFYHLLGSPAVKNEFSRLAAGATVKNLNIELVKKVKVPLPPLTEQKRIAAILDKADAIRKKRRKAIDLTETFLQSAFLEMFGDPVRNPKGWDKGTIESTVLNAREDIRCGPFGTQLKVHELVQSGVPLWGIENVLNDRFEPTTNKFLTAEKAEYLNRFDAKAGDVLVTRMGTIGRACVVPAGIGSGRISYHLFRIRPDRKKCLPGFLAATISRSGTFHAQLKRLAHGAIMDGLSTGILKEVQFLLPPIEKQKQYIDLVNVVERHTKSYASSSDKLEVLFSALAHRAFRGES